MDHLKREPHPAPHPRGYIADETAFGVIHRNQIVLSVKTRSQIKKDLWDGFVDSSDDAWFWHLSDYLDSLLLWKGREDLSFCVMKGDCIVGILPVHLVKRGGRFARFNRLDCPGGLACAPDISTKLKREIIELASKRLKSYFKAHGIWKATAFVAPMAPTMTRDDRPPTNPLLDLGFHGRPGHSWIVDLRKPEEEIFKAYSKSTRYDIRRVMKTPHVLREARSREDLKIYYEMHLETYARTGATPHPFGYFESMFNKHIPAGRCRILFFETDDNAVAAQNTCLYKQRAFYWTGASRSAKSGYETKLLFHEQILHAKRLGCEYYEAGLAHPNAPKGKAKSLSEFKRSFGAELSPFYVGVLESDEIVKRVLARGYDLVGGVLQK